jgi:anthranilate phosphoribosyltransferase
MSVAALIKHVGRGARLAKELGREDARTMMRAIATGAADAYQTGAFLLAMRMKSETAAELAGFVEALREVARFEAAADVDVDLHADGRAGRPSVTLAAACVAAAAGVRVLVRGWFRSPFARNDLGAAFARLGVDPARGAAAARRGLEAGVGVLDLDDYGPRVAELLALRERLGVRTCINSAVKLLDPTGARRVLVGIFHSPYHAPIFGAARLVGAERAAVVQAPGGVPELAPDKPTRVTVGDGGPLALGGGGAAPGTADSPEALADLLEAVLEGRASEGAMRMTALTAALLRWAAGHAADPQDSSMISESYAALAGGAAARVLAGVRLCYRT